MSGQLGFIKVVPAEVAQHGPAGAIVLAHIRYRCESDGPGRVHRDGHRWWRVSLTHLAAELGLSRDAVYRALKRLGGVVVAKHLEASDDRTMAYRVAAACDATTSQIAESRNGSTSDIAETQRSDRPYRDSAMGLSQVRDDHVANPRHALPIETLEKGGEAPGQPGAPAQPSPSPQSANSEPPQWIRGPYGPRCTDPDHVDHPDPPDCQGCKRARLAARADDAVQAEVEQQRRQAEAARIQHCPDCHGGHWMLDETGSPIDPAVRCTHARAGLTSAARSAS